MDQDRSSAPPESVAEVTLDGRLTGGRFVDMERPELLAILAEYGIEPVDTAGLADRPLSPDVG